MDSDTSNQVTHAFDKIVNCAWAGAKVSAMGKLSQKRCYELIDEINEQVTALKKILYTRSDP